MHNAHIVTLASIAFYLEEPAYQNLSSYLKSVEKHFADSPDRDEIVADIEHRIAELFSEDIKQPTDVISEARVAQIVAELGRADQFDDPTSENHSAKNTISGKVLMRDPQNAMFAGVCSGLGAYFDVDPLIFRILFIVFTFAGASGILIYLILWLIMPEARTASDRLRMRGQTVNVDGIAQQFREGAKRGSEQVKKVASTAAERLGHGNVTAAVQIVSRILGSVFMIIGGTLMAAFTSSFVISVLTRDRFVSGTPYAAFPSTLNEFAAVGIFFLIIALPILALIFAGATLTSNRPALHNFGWGILWSLWFIALSVGVGLLLNYQSEVTSQVQSIEQLHPEVRNIGPFWYTEVR